VVAALADAAKQLDLLCAREFWLESDFASLVEATKETLINVVHPTPRPGSGSCRGDDLASLGACETEIGALPGGCLGCLFNNVTDFSQCAGTGTETGEPAIFDNDSDSRLLSRYPILKQEIQPHDAHFQRGAGLYARIDIPTLGPVLAFCGHLKESR
jgi:hypothetical protein